MKISAAIITFNEEANMARCLESLEGVADEIVVMDSGSTDATQAICASFGVKFFQQAWQGYSKQKNDANALCTHDMVLSIDADEALTPELRAAILHLKSSEKSGVYSLNRLTNYCGTWIYHSGWYPDIKIRLFPKSAYWQGDIHEELMLPSNLKPELLPGHLAHYSYTSHKQHRERADRYSRLTAKKYVELGKKPFVFQPMLSAFTRFVKMYFIKLGFLDGIAGFHIARISAQSNYFKYREVKRLYDQRERN
jgi:(heptosyl)LPS beta-1,4-glucosyltransferase